VGVLGVDEDPEEAVQPHVDARGLEHLLVERLDAHPAGVDLGPQITVRQQHGHTLVARTGIEWTSGSGVARARLGASRV
jgi:hypothetical protein